MDGVQTIFDSVPRYQPHVKGYLPHFATYGLFCNVLHDWGSLDEFSTGAAVNIGVWRGRTHQDTVHVSSLSNSPSCMLPIKGILEQTLHQRRRIGHSLSSVQDSIHACSFSTS